MFDFLYYLIPIFVGILIIYLAGRRRGIDQIEKELLKKDAEISALYAKIATQATKTKAGLIEKLKEKGL